MQLHHIMPESVGGPDTAENCIPLCLDCHEEVGSYNPKHPIGRKFSPEELTLHRDLWFEVIRLHPERLNAAPGPLFLQVGTTQIETRPPDTAGKQDVSSRFAELATRLESLRRSDAIFESAEGAKQAWEAIKSLFNLIEQKAKRIAEAAKHLGLKPGQAGPYQASGRDKMQLVVVGPGGLSLDLEACGPATNSAVGAWCSVTVFRSNRERRDAGRNPEPLEDHRFTPEFSGQGNVSWLDPQKVRYSAQELCDFAFELFLKHIEDWFQSATGQ
jgi:HNH endonuclease